MILLHSQSPVAVLPPQQQFGVAVNQTIDHQLYPKSNG